jgi:hypothetical protein
MLSKHGRQWHDPKQPPTQRLQANVDALASANLISASRAEALLADAEAAGVRGLKRCLPAPGLKNTGKFSRNTARGWKRRKLKDSQWQQHYYFQCRLWDPKKNEIRGNLHRSDSRDHRYNGEFGARSGTVSHPLSR